MKFENYIENKYQEYKKINGTTKKIAESWKFDGFVDWWTTFINEGKDHSGYWKDFMKDGAGKVGYEEYKGKAKLSENSNSPVKYLVYIIANKLYKEESKDDESLFKEGKFKDENTYFKTINKIIKKERGLNIREDKKNNNKWFWIDILSALQAEFKLFESLKDLNEFIRKIYLPTIDKQKESVDKQKEPVAIKSFGLYVRRLEHLCFAYTIFKGENFVFAEELIKTLSGIKKTVTKTKVDKTKVEEIRENIDNRITYEKMEEFDNLKSLSKADFIKKIEKSYDSFCFIEESFHTTIVTRILEILEKSGANVESRIDTEICYEEVLGEDYDKENTLLDELKTNLKGKIVPPRTPVLDGVSDEKISPYSVELTDENSLYLRRLLILALMKSGFNNTAKKYFNKYYHESAYDFIGGINNDELIELGLSKIEVSHNLDNTLKNENLDLFDWFITECILYDEKEQREEGGSEKLYVTGFKQFKKYMSGVFTFDEQ